MFVRVRIARAALAFGVQHQSKRRMAWVLAITQPRKELAVAAALSDLNISHHIFKYKVSIVKRGKVGTKLIVAFARYIFVEIAEDWMWRAIREITGVLKFACDYTTQVPWYVHPSVVEKFKTLADKDGILPYIAPSKFRFGDKVWVASINSVVSGRAGIYQYPTHVGRSCVLMDWLGCLRPVEIDDQDLERYEPRFSRRRGRRGGRNRRRSGGIAQPEMRAGVS